MKLILEILENGKVIKTKEYKTLKQIQHELPMFDYHQLRAVYLECTGKEKRKRHSLANSLCRVIRIRDKYEHLSEDLQLLTSS